MKHIDSIKNILAYTKTSKSGYQGKDFETGYHSLQIGDVYFKGQRDPNLRLKDVPYDFSNKVVLDIGSNQGGMLFAVKNSISKGIGVDYDYRLINASNSLTKLYNTNNINFFVHNLDKDPLHLISDYNNQEKFDIVFLLSVCMWIKSWKEVIQWVSENSNACLFETNGSKVQQQEQIDELKKYFNVTLVNEKSLDDPKQHKRKLFLCQ